MCGIVGYAGYREAQPIIIESLKRLEYRGYDSCGIAALGDTLVALKDVGRVVDFEKSSPRLHGKMGIGHTRWATHGAVTAANAHPHLDCSGKFAVVHNGIIENFQKLREGLEKEGHHFNSDTDTEVIAHLIEKYYQGDLAEAVLKALADITGTYAVVVTAEGHNELVAGRRESPLVLGVGDKENFIASDVAAILDHTDRAIYLEDGDFCIVSQGSIEISNNNQKVNRETNVIPW
ncbi:glutamine--fructose-6-phosphate aminotransferase, partial [Chloroflexota bacterium]